MFYSLSHDDFKNHVVPSSPVPLPPSVPAPWAVAGICGRRTSETGTKFTGLDKNPRFFNLTWLLTARYFVLLPKEGKVLWWKQPEILKGFMISDDLISRNLLELFL